MCCGASASSSTGSIDTREDLKAIVFAHAELSCGRPVVWWVILPWRLGAVQAVRRNSGSGHEKAADAGLGPLLWGQDGHSLPPQVDAKREWRPFFFACRFDFFSST